MRSVLPLAFLGPSICTAQLLAQAPDIADMTLEQLGNLRVTTATLRPERFYDAPASIFVITREDIRRSGALSLPEALRLAPNLEVARVSASDYAISARGFQNVITNKLLVLVDGRTLYTTVLSGVLWDAQDVMLEDIERIEVISGPGAALYGANAFGGVINIISHSAKDSQGTVLLAGGGRINRDASVRHGGKLGDNGAYRAYAMHIERDGLRPAAAGIGDDTTKDQAGFRMDFGRDASTATLQGDVYSSTKEGNGAQRTKLSGANLIARWNNDWGDGAHSRLQAYYDHAKRDDPAGFRDDVSTFDLEAQYDFAAWGRHRISLGAGYRYAIDDTTPTGIVRFIPEDKRLHWTSAFAQDEITLADGVALTLGGRVQTTAYVNPEFMPDARLEWKVGRKQLLWTSASRVARTPGRVDRELFIPANPPFLVRGNPDFESETGNAYEIGYRAEPTPRLTFSLTAFHTKLDNLRGGKAAGDGSSFVANEVEGTTTGLEAWAMFQPSDRWRITAGLLELSQDLRAKDGSGNLGGPAGLGNDPRHTVKLRAFYRVSDTVDVNVGWRYVSSLSYLKTVPAYEATDFRVAWRAANWLELSLHGTDLFHKGHVEFDEHGLPATIPRAFYFQVRMAY